MIMMVALSRAVKSCPCFSVLVFFLSGGLSRRLDEAKIAPATAATRKQAKSIAHGHMRLGFGSWSGGIGVLCNRHPPF